MDKTTAMVVVEPGRLEQREFPLPTIGEEDGLLRVELVGVCGSDPGIVNGKATRAERPYPIIPGHEIVGRVEAMGPAARARHGVEIGDRVIIEYAFGCGRCRDCLSGNYQTCQAFLTYGNLISCAQPPHLYGGYARHLYIDPRAMVHRLGEDVSPEVGVLIGAVLGNAVRWLHQIGGAAIGRPVVIVGPGQQGLAATLVAREAGAGPIAVIGLAADKSRLELAREFGADAVIMADEDDPVEAVAELTHGRMGAVVMDVTGRPVGARTALSVAGPGANVVLPGLYGRGVETPLELDRLVFNEIKLIGVYSHNFRSVEPAIDIARRNGPLLEKMISHRFPLDRAAEAVALVGGAKPEENPIKVVIEPWA